MYWILLILYTGGEVTILIEPLTNIEIYSYNKTEIQLYLHYSTTNGLVADYHMKYPKTDYI